MEMQFPNKKIWYGQKCTGSKCDDESQWPEYGKSGWTGNWANGQPNCGNSNCGVCARSHTSGSGGEWNDGNCNEKYRFLCRRLDEWEKSHGYWWMRVDFPTTHAKAVDFCAARGPALRRRTSMGRTITWLSSSPARKFGMATSAPAANATIPTAGACWTTDGSAIGPMVNRIAAQAVARSAPALTPPEMSGTTVLPGGV